MNEELVAQFVEQVKADCGDSGFCGASGDAEGMLQLELTVHENLMRLGRETVRRLVQEIGTGHLGSEVNHEGQAYRFKGYRPKTVHGLYGAVRILRAYYATGSGSGWAPLDEQLGIGDGQTPGCAYHLALFVGSEPYQSGRSRDIVKSCGWRVKRRAHHPLLPLSKRLPPSALRRRMSASPSRAV